MLLTNLNIIVKNKFIKDILFKTRKKKKKKSAIN